MDDILKLSRITDGGFLGERVAEIWNLKVRLPRLTTFKLPSDMQPEPNILYIYNTFYRLSIPSMHILAIMHIAWEIAFIYIPSYDTTWWRKSVELW